MHNKEKRTENIEMELNLFVVHCTMEISLSKACVAGWQPTASS